MEKCTMLKTEVQANGDIFLFYVDENGAPLQNTDGVVTLDQDQLQQLQENYVLEEATQEVIESTESPGNVVIQSVQSVSQPDQVYVTQADRWLDDEVEKLLIFYIDNKEAFHNPAMNRLHLWTVACKAMIIGKNPTACDLKIRALKRKYTYMHVDYLMNKNDATVWPFYGLCHQAFEDDSYVQMTMRENGIKEKTVVKIPTAKQDVEATNVITKLTNSVDVKIKQMLQIYLHYKKAGGYMWQKNLWEKIAIQIGEDAEFWHKRFLNFKQHYIRMLEKRNELGAQSVTWPYMELFDQIFSDDSNFKRKYGSLTVETNKNSPPAPKNLPVEWNDTEKTVLVKYYFDCIAEFQDSSIPNGFLWNEVGRLLDKKPEECRMKYEQLRKDHLMEYIGENYSLRSRKPISILFDNIISQEVENRFYQESNDLSAAEMKWKTEKIDEMVQFLFDKIEMFKDPVCHFVCWAAVALKIKENVLACKEQWNDLTTLYKHILNEKKEDTDLQIDWRYIDIFDRIFDYGMDTKLLEGYDSKPIVQPKQKKPVLRNKEKQQQDVVPDNLSDLEPEEFEDKSSGEHSRGVSDPKQIKILEYYLKYKDKFGTTPRKRQAMWAALASTLNISAEQCAQSFKNLKQLYMAYIKREISKPDIPILWPYFSLCKKVFGYRLIRNKLKQTVMELGDVEEWTPREIKILINYFGQNRDVNDDNAHEASSWASLARDMSKSETACRDKFIDLRKSYRKIITMMGRNPDCKYNWKYFKFFDEIYSKASVGGMEVDSADESAVTPYQLPVAVQPDVQDDDLQCIIVIPEGDENVNANNAQIIINKEDDPLKPKPILKWTKNQRISLLNSVLEYVRANKGKVIDKRDLWKEVSSKINKPPYNCNRCYSITKKEYKSLKDKKKLSEINASPLLSIMHKIMALKPKFTLSPTTDEDVILKEQTTYQDVALPLWKVELALKYYLEHIEEFVDPKYDQKTAWISLGKSVPVTVTKIFRKINYLKQFFNSETNEVNGAKFEFADILKNVLEKEFEYRINMGSVPEPMAMDDETEAIDWTDEETEQLLTWYLSNLDKFKSSKFVPSYLWAEASKVLSKSAMACSKQMTEVRSQYSTMVKENPEALNSWRFFELCQKIYGTGKKNTEQEQQQ